MNKASLRIICRYSRGTAKALVTKPVSLEGDGDGQTVTDQRDRFGPRNLNPIPLVIVWCLVITITASGCESLRKKFTRQKKKEDTASGKFIPVLEPEEYPSKEHNPLAAYQYHYDLFKVWHRDLEATIEDRMTDKRQKYAYTNALIHLNAMVQLLNGPAQEHLGTIKKHFENVGRQLDQPAAMRSYPSISTEIRLIGKDIRKGFLPEDVKDIFPESL